MTLPRLGDCEVDGLDARAPSVARADSATGTTNTHHGGAVPDIAAARKPVHAAAQLTQTNSNHRGLMSRDFTLTICPQNGAKDQCAFFLP